MAIRVLATGDIHIGRCSTKAEDLDRPGRWPCSGAWEQLVQLAIEERVDLVALSGDVVDRENRYYEAIGPLERGLRTLKQAGIQVFAVTGNHDFDVLPRVVDDLGGADSGFHLLGRGGCWEESEFQRQGTTQLRIQGWSFPKQHVHTDPLASCDLPNRNDGVPTLGLLHADLDAAASTYAPVTTAALRSQAVDFWLLGHIHHPRFEPPRHGGGAILYPGSPQAMHPGEPGAHGPWLLTFPSAGSPSATQHKISIVRYENVEVDLNGIEDLDDASRHVRDEIDARLEQAETESNGRVRWLNARVRFVGRTSLQGKLQSWREEFQSQYRPTRGEVNGRVESLEDATRPAIELEQLAQMRNPAGRLAEMVLCLERDDLNDGLERLLQDARRKLDDLDRAPAYLAIRDDATPERDAIRLRLIRQGMRLLDTLIDQRQGEPA